MRSFWALPAVLRLVTASQQEEFSVQNDLLAFPQYQVVYSDSYVSASEADELLAASRQRELQQNTHPNNEPLEHRLDLQKPLKHDATFGSESHQSQNQDSSASTNSAPAESYERLILQSRPYLCMIPQVKSPHPLTNVSSSATSEEAAAKTREEKKQKELELIRATNHGWELLKGMQGHCLYSAAGWWVYSLCYNEPAGIRQFHPLPQQKSGVPPEEDSAVQSYVLGRFDTDLDGGVGKAQIGADTDTGAEDASEDKLEQSKQKEGTESDKTTPKDGKSVADDEDAANANANANANALSKTRRKKASSSSSSSSSTKLATHNSQTYLVRELGGGTTCDVTGLPRRVSVQFHCNPNESDHIAMIKETASCVYLMVIHTPRLCNDVAFLPPTKDLPNHISCREIIDESSPAAMKDWRQRKARHAEALLTGKAQFGDAVTDPTPNPGAGFGGGDLGTDAAPKKEGDHVIIGGVALGAQKLVGGAESRTIKASEIIFKGAGAGSGRDVKVIAKLAESDGKNTHVMTQREITKQGLDKKGITREKVDEVVRELEKQDAGEGVPWRINLVQTARGLEFSAVKIVVKDENPPAAAAAAAAATDAASSSGEEPAGNAENAAGKGGDTAARANKDKKPDEKAQKQPGKGDAGSEEEYK